MSLGPFGVRVVWVPSGTYVCVAPPVLHRVPRMLYRVLGVLHRVLGSSGFHREHASCLTLLPQRWARGSQGDTPGQVRLVLVYIVFSQVFARCTNGARTASDVPPEAHKGKGCVQPDSSKKTQKAKVPGPPPPRGGSKGGGGSKGEGGVLGWVTPITHPGVHHPPPSPASPATCLHTCESRRLH